MTFDITGACCSAVIVGAVLCAGSGLVLWVTRPIGCVFDIVVLVCGWTETNVCGAKSWPGGTFGQLRDAVTLCMMAMRLLHTMDSMFGLGFRTNMVGYELRLMCSPFWPNCLWHVLQVGFHLTLLCHMCGIIFMREGGRFHRRCLWHLRTQVVATTLNVWHACGFPVGSMKMACRKVALKGQ